MVCRMICRDLWDGGDIPNSDPHCALLLIYISSCDCYLLEGSSIWNRAAGTVDIHGL